MSESSTLRKSEPRVPPYAPLELKPLEWSGSPEPVRSNEDARDKGRDGRYLVSGECVSCYLERVRNGFVGFIIFDRPPIVRISFREYKLGKRTFRELNPTVEPRFEGFGGCCDRFRECLTNYLKNPEAASTFRENPGDVAKDILLRFTLEGHMEILPKLRLALNYVDESMFDNKALHRSLLEWGISFGLWRKILRHDLNSVGCIGKILKHLINTGHSETPQLDGSEDLEIWFKTLQEKMEHVEGHVNSTFTAITLTMSIVESQRAIAQAEEVSKLMNLAFFIPLTLSAGIFGMNIVPSTSARSESPSRGPSYLESLNRNNLSKTVDRQFRLLMHFFRRYGMRVLREAAYIAALASLAVGIWAITTKLHLPTDEKAKVGFGLGVLLPVMLLIWPSSGVQGSVLMT
ncbi:hypothetical protein FGG08_007302 [Glutinoglossum americanum]|uniref:Uncharacterized protein n=1 Tax=Glutinoglossum americanum TaxID=1670608 RepID=A0A9P8HZS2_9PEZI|nr:hypothetical protein FGG08_007302 [Glutinoglossum americanum]